MPWVCHPTSELVRRHQRADHPNSVPRAEVFPTAQYAKKRDQSGRIGARLRRAGKRASASEWLGLASHRPDRNVRLSAAPSFTLRGYLETWRRIDVWPDSVQVLGETLPHCGCPAVSLCGSHMACGLVGRRARRGWKGVPGRQPADQPSPAHHGRGPAPQPHRRPPRPLRRQESRRQDLDGSHPRPQTTAVQRRLQRDARQQETTRSDQAREGNRGRPCNPA
jgi:hypothetical protein